MFISLRHLRYEWLALTVINKWNLILLNILFMLIYATNVNAVINFYSRKIVLAPFYVGLDLSFINSSKSVTWFERCGPTLTIDKQIMFQLYAKFLISVHRFRVSSVSVVWDRGSILCRSKRFFSQPLGPDRRLWGHPVFCPIGVDGPFSGNKTRPDFDHV